MGKVDISTAPDFGPVDATFSTFPLLTFDCYSHQLVKNRLLTDKSGQILKLTDRLFDRHVTTFSTFRPKHFLTFDRRLFPNEWNEIFICYSYSRSILSWFMTMTRDPNNAIIHWCVFDWDKNKQPIRISDTSVNKMEAEHMVEAVMEVEVNEHDERKI